MALTSLWNATHLMRLWSWLPQWVHLDLGKLALDGTPGLPLHGHWFGLWECSVSARGSQQMKHLGMALAGSSSTALE